MESGGDDVIAGSSLEMTASGRTNANECAAESVGPTVHVSTLTAALKKARFVWKRTRHSLKKRDPKRCKQAQEELAELRGQAQAGEIELAYAGWQPSTVMRLGVRPMSSNL